MFAIEFKIPIKVVEIYVGELEVFELSCMGLSPGKPFRKTRKEPVPLLITGGPER